MSVVAVAFMRPKAESADDVRDALLKAAAQVHNEPGCELYSLHEGREQFIVIEKWEDLDALKTHGNAPALKELLSTIKELLREPMEVHIGNPVDASSSPLGNLK